MNQIRQAAVAGMFYPADKRQLTQMVTGFLSSAGANGFTPKALIAPHAGYIYSGPIAASAYVYLQPIKDAVERVILLGPAHRLAVRGLAASSAEAFATPLGTVTVNVKAVQSILALPQVQIVDAAHVGEHSLEVHLPFLQLICPKFSFVPLLVGDSSGEEVAEVLDMLWGGPETLIIVSSDLSHFHDYATAQVLDKKTAEAIEKLNPAGLHHDSACGRVPIQGLLTMAQRTGMKAHTVDLRSSGDTAGGKDRVVGYGAFLFT